MLPAPQGAKMVTISRNYRELEHKLSSEGKGIVCQRIESITMSSKSIVLFMFCAGELVVTIWLDSSTNRLQNTCDVFTLLNGVSSTVDNFKGNWFLDGNKRNTNELLFRSACRFKQDYDAVKSCINLVLKNRGLLRWAVNA